MKFLILSDFEPVWNHGAAGTILETSRVLEERGHTVVMRWREPARHALSPNLRRLFQTPGIQLRQTREAFREQDFDIALFSQPHCWRAFRWLARHHPKCLRLNRSHGWELRSWEAYRHYYPPADAHTFSRQCKDSLTHAQLKRHCQEVVRWSDGIITPNLRCADYIRQHHLDASDPDKVRTIHWGISATTLPARPARKPDEPLRLIFAGNYIGIKGIQYMPRLFADALSAGADFNVTLCIAEESIAQAEADLRPILGARLSLRPWLPREQLQVLFGEMDAYLALSPFEGYYKSATEAMAQGLCPIGFREGVLYDIGRDGHNGLFAAVGDLDTLVTRLRRASDDPSLCHSLGQQAQRDIVPLTWEHCAEAIEHYVLDLRRNGSSPNSHPAS